MLANAFSFQLHMKFVGFDATSHDANYHVTIATSRIRTCSYATRAPIAALQRPESMKQHTTSPYRAELAMRPPCKAQPCTASITCIRAHLRLASLLPPRCKYPVRSPNCFLQSLYSLLCSLTQATMHLLRASLTQSPCSDRQPRNAYFAEKFWTSSILHQEKTRTGPTPLTYMSFHITGPTYFPPPSSAMRLQCTYLTASPLQIRPVPLSSLTQAPLLVPVLSTPSPSFSSKPHSIHELNSAKRCQDSSRRAEPQSRKSNSNKYAGELTQG